MAIETGALMLGGCFLTAAVLLGAAVFMAGCRGSSQYNHEDEVNRDVAAWAVESNGVNEEGEG